MKSPRTFHTLSTPVSHSALITHFLPLWFSIFVSLHTPPSSTLLSYFRATQSEALPLFHTAAHRKMEKQGHM